MPELTDDQLDGLFRKSAEEFDPPFDPVAWRDMKTRLDANDRTVTGGAKIWKTLLRWGLPVLLLLLLTGGAWYAYRRTYTVAVKPSPQLITKAKPTLNQKARPAQRTTLTSDNEPVQTSTADSKEFDDAAKQPTHVATSVAEPAKSENRFEKPVVKRDAAAGVNVISSPEVATKRPLLADGLKTKSNRLRRSRATTSVSAVPENVAVAGYNSGKIRTQKGRMADRKRKYNQIDAGRIRLAASAMNDERSATSIRQRKTGRAESVQVAVTTTSGQIPVLEPGEFGPAILSNVNELAIRPGKWARLLTFASREVVAQPDTVTRSSVPKQASPWEKGLSVWIVVAPDLSAVGLHNFSRPGTNFGVLLEYRLASRWSIQTGIIQSTKVYRAQSSEYDFPWMWPVDPTSIDGRCNMLDIPINVRYDFALRPRLDGRLPNRWFVSGGLTSYVIKQEDYVYNFSGYVHNPPPPPSGKFGNYGFSQLNLSVGYERSFSKRFSWQVEPFIKMPLKGVGYFKVNLISTGAFFSIRYKLSK